MALQDLTPQLRTRLGRVERLVGLFVIVAIILMLTGLVYYVRHTAAERGWFTLRVPYYTMIADGTGVKVGAPVTMLGFTVGEITEVNTTELSKWMRDAKFNVFVGFTIRDPYHGYIWTDSKVKLGAGDLLGGRSLEVVIGDSGFVTVVTKSGEPARMMSDKYAWKAGDDNFNYVTLEEQPKGYYLRADQDKPLTERLTEIANQVNDALPGVLAMTNQLNVALANLTNITGQVSTVMPQVEGAITDLRLLVATVQPALQRPGGIGDLLLPTNLNTQLTLTLSNLNPGVGPLAETLGGVNQRLAELGLLLTNVNTQLDQNTNLVANVNELTQDAGSLMQSIETLLRRHWLLRSAFKTNDTKKGPVTRPPDRSRF